MEIRRDDLTGPEIRELLAEHVRNMYSISPPGSVHVLDAEALRKPGVTFWSAWSGLELLGCGALKELTPEHGEVKSMRTAPAHRRGGVGRAILRHILDEATRRGYRRLSLETGAQVAFEPARRLYESFGFMPCPPFDGYADDPNSVFMTMELPRDEDRARELVTTRRLEASAGEVFAAFADPDRLARWWGPEGFRNTFETFDLRPGGAWRFTMHAPDGKDFPNESIFVQVAPECVVFDHRTAPRFRMSIAFSAAGSGTLVTWRQRFETADECRRVGKVAVAANEQNLDRLEALLRSGL